jgi:hypothetical protein
MGAGFGGIGTVLRRHACRRSLVGVGAVLRRCGRAPRVLREQAQQDVAVASLRLAPAAERLAAQGAQGFEEARFRGEALADVRLVLPDRLFSGAYFANFERVCPDRFAVGEADLVDKDYPAAANIDIVGVRAPCLEVGVAWADVIHFHVLNRGGACKMTESRGLRYFRFFKLEIGIACLVT